MVKQPSPFDPVTVSVSSIIAVEDPFKVVAVTIKIAIVVTVLVKKRCLRRDVSMN